MQRLLLLLLPLALAISLPAFAQEKAPAPRPKPPAPGKLKIDAGKLKGLKKGGEKNGKASMAMLNDQARQVTRGYYKALIDGNYERAASFLHPDAIEPSRKALVDTLEKNGEGQTKATLQTMGVADLNTLRTMPAERFFVAYAKSPMGKGVQVLNGLAVRVVLEPPRCDVPSQSCQVTLALKGDTPKGDKIDKTNVVYVQKVDSRYLLSHSPPKK